MFRKSSFYLLILCVVLSAFVWTAHSAISAAASAAPKDYQVTGPVLEVTDTMIAVQKGKDRWELGRDANTKVNGGDLKVGATVTIHYTMTAGSVDVHPAKATAAKPKKP